MNNFDISFNISNTYTELFILLICSILLAYLLIILSYSFVYQQPDSEKLSIYECGYEPYENTRSMFNIKFYLIAIFFIIFDIEILFIIPWIIEISNSNLLSLWIIFDFILELILGFFLIWYSNCLNWK
jgi:NADH:ubiquinone oxidoreductase subunit 3 (subunit A)